MVVSSRPKRGASTASLDSLETPVKKRLVTIQGIVAQKLRDNFKGASSEETDLKVNPEDGKTLRKRLHDDIEAALSKGKRITWGRNYYDDLKAIYLDGVDAHKSLTSSPEQKLLEVNQALSLVMEKAMDAKPNRAGMVDWLSRCRAVPNAKEIRGILRWAITLRPGCVKQLQDCKKVMQFLLRLDVKSVHADAVDVVQGWLSAVHLAMLAKSRGLKEKDEQFVSSNRSTLGLVFQKSDVDAVVGRSGDWSAVADNLLRMTQSCKLGRVLLDEQLSKVMQEKVDAIIVKHATKVFAKGQHVTVQSLEAAKIDCLDEIEALEAIDALPAKRIVRVVYRRMVFKVGVANFTDEVSVKFMAIARGIGVRIEILVPTFAEEILIPKEQHCPEEAQVHPDVLANAVRARRALANVITDNSVGSADVLAKLIAQKSANIVGEDGDAVLELSMFREITTEDGESRLQLEILRTLPSDKSLLSVDAVCTRLQALGNGKLFKYSSRTAQEKLKMCQKLVECIAEHRIPNVKHYAQDEFMAKVLVACSWFVSYKKGGQAKIFGSAAIAETVKEIITKHGKGESKIDEVLRARVFSWLMTEDHRKQLEEIHRALSAGGAAAKAKAKAKASASISSAPADKKAKQKQAVDESAKKKAASMFED